MSAFSLAVPLMPYGLFYGTSLQAIVSLCLLFLMVSSSISCHFFSVIFALPNKNKGNTGEVCGLSVTLRHEPQECIEANPSDDGSVRFSWDTRM